MCRPVRGRPGAQSLTYRLLAFSRRQTLSPRAIVINRLMSDFVELVRRTVGPAQNAAFNHGHIGPGMELLWPSHSRSKTWAGGWSGCSGEINKARGPGLIPGPRAFA